MVPWLPSPSALAFWKDFYYLDFTGIFHLTSDPLEFRAMSISVDIPTDLRSTTATLRALPAVPPPIDDSMVRHHLSVNVPESYPFRQRTPSRKPSFLRSGRATSPSSAVSSRSSSSSSSTSSSDTQRAAEAKLTFYSRLLHVEYNPRSRPPSPLRPPPSPPAAAAAVPLPLPLLPTPVVRCQTTVRETIAAIHDVPLAGTPSHGRATFFWLDLHGIPPPSLPRHRHRRHHRDSTSPLPEAEPPDASMKDLWEALGLQPVTANLFERITEYWQEHPNPDCTSLDDIYDEEMVDLSCPTDRVVHLQRLRSCSVADASTKNDERAAASSTTAATASEAVKTATIPRPTHYVLVELATLLATTTSMMATPAMRAMHQGWSIDNLLTSSYASGQEESIALLSGELWSENLGRSGHTFPVSFKDNLPRRMDASLNLPATPQIASTYALCFPHGCVTWCPSSRLDYEAANPQNNGSDLALTLTLMRHVKSWDQLQSAVFHRMRHVMQSSVSPSDEEDRPQTVQFTTADFFSLLLSTVCYAYLPRTSSVLSEVDVIDSMLPMIELNVESDQADALRRVLLLRRKLAVHRRLLFQKVRLLEELGSPSLRTLAYFMPCGAASMAQSNSISRGLKSKVGAHRSTSRLEMPRIRQEGSAVGAAVANSATEPTPLHLSSPLPTVTVIHKGVSGILRQLDAARSVLGTTTLIYASAVNFNNTRTSESADIFALLCQYMLLVVLPLSIIASQWGMNCYVPWMEVSSTGPFWGLVGVMAIIGIIGFAVPFYAYKTKKLHLIS